MQRFIPKAIIGQVHGEIIEKEIKSLGKLVILPCYHPAAALYNRSLRKILEEDFGKIPEIIKM